MFPREEVSINIQLMRNGLMIVISVDCEHGTGMEHVAPTSATNPKTLVGQVFMYIMVRKETAKQYCKKNVCVYLNSSFFSSLQVKNKRHDAM
jgi:hypothetical protein